MAKRFGYVSFFILVIGFVMISTSLCVMALDTDMNSDMNVESNAYDEDAVTVEAHPVITVPESTSTYVTEETAISTYPVTEGSFEPVTVSVEPEPEVTTTAEAVTIVSETIPESVPDTISSVSDEPIPEPVSSVQTTLPAILPESRDASGKILVPDGQYGIVQGSCTDEQFSNAVEYWSHIPLEWRERFVSDGWVMYVTDENFWSSYGYSIELIGIAVYAPKTIYVSGRTHRIAVAVVHEFAHYVDCVNGFPSESDEFGEIFNREKNGFEQYMPYGDNHLISNCREYFAAVFNQLIEYPQSESSAPDSFAFVRRYLDCSIYAGSVLD